MRAGRLLFGCALALGTAMPVCAAAQETAGMVIRGRIVGPDTAPIGGQSVVLHRVQGGQGATIAEAETSVAGEFALRAPPDADASALYFVATRYDTELYIGPAFRAGQETAMNQVIQVGLPGTSASAILGDVPAAVPQPMGRAVTSRNWMLLVIPLVGVSAVAVYALVPRPRIRHDRALLIRLAELDERMSGAPPAQRESLSEERSRLMAQLRAS